MTASKRAHKSRLKPPPAKYLLLKFNLNVIKLEMLLVLVVTGYFPGKLLACREIQSIAPAVYNGRGHTQTKCCHQL